MQSIKEHNLKANHNAVQILRHLKTLYAIYQRTQSESKSQQLGWRTTRDLSVCNLSKNTIWKQITTTNLKGVLTKHLYAIYQRTQSESKSQLYGYLYSNHASVCNLSKNTIWKQITTCLSTSLMLLTLYAIYQRTQSESKSQPSENTSPVMSICMQSIKEHNLKANHNSFLSISKQIKSVCNLSKNTIWKQITTRWRLELINIPLCAIYQRTLPLGRDETNLKANHNLMILLTTSLQSVCNLSKNTPARAGWNKSESKSQLWVSLTGGLNFCMQSIKEHSR